MPNPINRDGEQFGGSGWRYKTHRGLSCGVSSQTGQIPVTVTCPYCDTMNDSYLWSIAGSGKRCDGCFALICQGIAIPPDEKTLARLPKKDERRTLWSK